MCTQYLSAYAVDRDVQTNVSCALLCQEEPSCKKFNVVTHRQASLLTYCSRPLCCLDYR